MKWWWLVLISVALGGGVGYFIRSKQPDVYYTTASIWFGNNLQSPTDQGNLSLPEVQDLITIYGALARQSNILQPVIDKLNLGMSVDALNNVISIQSVEQLPILNVIVGDTDAVRAADISNAIAQEIIDNSRSSADTEEAKFKREQLRKIQAQITQLQTDYDNLLAKSDTLTSALDIEQNNAQLASISATLKDTQGLYATMSLGVGDQSGSLRMFTFADAVSAIKVTNSFLNVILSGVAGLLLSLATIVLIAFFDDRLQWSEGMGEIMGVKVLGPLGIIPGDKLPLYAVNMPTAVETEMLRQLRAKIVLAAGGTLPKVVSITSYDSGDGKTITASNLAVAWAQSGTRTLLVDGDMRKGNLHEIFRLPNIMGLSDILAGRDEVPVLVSRALLESGYENLTILSAGRSTADPASLLSKPRFAAMMSVLKSQFDIIVMDSVPTIGGPDSAFIGEASSGVVIVVHAQRTTHKSFQRTLQTLGQGQNVTIYGVTFNRIALQVTSTYSQPYYRRTLAISPEKLNRELLNAGKRGGIFNFNRHIIVDRKSGSRLYSLAASAVQLGVNETTLKDWIKSGYLKAERRGRRQWIQENVMTNMVESLPRHSLISVAEPQPIIQESRAPLPDDSTAKANSKRVSTGKIPDKLRGQRDALLAASMREKPSEEPKDNG